MPKRQTDWSSLAARPADKDVTPASKPHQLDEPPLKPTPESATQPAPAPQSVPPAPATRVRPRRVVKIPVTYRLPEECLDLIETAVDQAAARGEKLTREQAVTDAIRLAYGQPTT